MWSLTYPRTESEAVRAHRDLAAADTTTEYKAGGTDVVDRARNASAAPSALVHLGRMRARSRVVDEADHVRVGAGVTLRQLAVLPALQSARAVVEAADHTATPQIRALATVGGALAQRPRCWYFRHPDYFCAKEGGGVCFAQQGDNAPHAIFDNDICAAPHPSTLAAALLAVDASLEIMTSKDDKTSKQTLSAADVFRVPSGSPRVENALPAGALITAVLFPRATLGGRQGYRRASARELADWADVEVAVRADLAGGVITDARVVLGGVARVPHRARATEAALNGARPTPEALRAAAARAVEGATPLSGNAHKVPLARATVEATLLEVLA